MICLHKHYTIASVHQCARAIVVVRVELCPLGQSRVVCAVIWSSNVSSYHRLQATAVNKWLMSNDQHPPPHCCEGTLHRFHVSSNESRIPLHISAIVLDIPNCVAYSLAVRALQPLEFSNKFWSYLQCTKLFGMEVWYTQRALRSEELLLSLYPSVTGQIPGLYRLGRIRMWVTR
jgi:predicted metallopeptidase